MTRRGVTLVELLLVLTLLGVLAAAAAGVVLHTTRSAVRGRGALLAERAEATIVALLRHELRDAEAGDLVAVPAGIAFARRVGEGVVCDVDGGGVTMARAGWWGDRTPDAGRDRIATLPAVALPWSGAALATVASAPCPGGGPGWRLAPASPAAVLRVTEPVVLRGYTADGVDWLGLLPGGGGSVQPFAGPFRRGSLRFDLTDGAFGVAFVTLPGRSVRLAVPLATP